jgi:hypothetical protein
LTGCCRDEWPPMSPGPELPVESGFGKRTIVLLFPPEPYEESSPSALLALEEAILSLCRVVFDGGGRIALRADPDIAPFVAEIAAESGGRGGVQVLVGERRDDALVDELERTPTVQLVQGDELSSFARLEPLAAIVFGDPSRTEEDQGALESRRVRIVSTDAYVAATLEREERSYEPEEIPYPYVMQRLVASILEEELPG